MIPNQAIASAELPLSEYLQPLIPESSLIDYEYGGVALNDPSQGLSVKLWTFRVVGDEVRVGAADVPDGALFTAEGVTAISGTFDQNMAPQVAFVQGGIARYWWFDTLEGEYVITDLAEGTLTPKMKLDDRRELQGATNDVILSYVLNDNLYFRAQRDRYETEYLLKEAVGGTIRHCGMTRSLRFGWDIAGGSVTGITFLNALPNAELGDAVSFTYQVSGGLPPYTFTVVSGDFPPGIELRPRGGVSGTLTESGTFEFTVQVVDAVGVATQLAETVEVSVLGISGAAPDGIVGAAYSFTYTTSGGVAPFSYSISSGAIPAGLTLDEDTGEIFGNLATAAAYTWRVRVTDSLGDVATVDDEATVVAVLTITNPAPNIVANLAYSHTYTAAGGAGGNVWSLAGTLPTGITWDDETATLSGTTVDLGDFTWTVQVEDSEESIGTLNEAVTVNADVPFIITLANGTIIETTGATIQFRDAPGKVIDLEDLDDE
jgi:hypothetical protein